MIELRPLAVPLALLCGCGSEPDAPGAEPQKAPSNVAPAVAKARSTAPPARVGERKKLYDASDASEEPWHADNRARVDAAKDGWPLEALAQRAQPVLERLAREMWSPSCDEARLAPFLAADFCGASLLRPEDLESTFDDGNQRIARWPIRVGFTEAVAAGSFAPNCAALRAPLGGATPRISVWIEHVGFEEGGFSTHARLHVAADVGTGAVQQNQSWWLRWSDAGGDPKLRQLACSAYEECTIRAKTFADHTGRWIGSPPWLEREFLHGLSDAYMRQDKMTGNHLLGNQGLAVGDVNGDGLDDVYVCTQGGIPNRLLLQQPDGTVIDGTSAAKLGLLDNTRSALILDMDRDGAPDLVAAVGPYLWLAFNDGRGVFEDQMLLGGKELGDEEIFSIAAADPDRDGNLDVYCCRYVPGGMISGVPKPYHDANNGAPNIYWRNLGGRRFVNATDEVGFGSSNAKYSMAALWEDLDDDGDLDLFVSNDFGRSNYFVNEYGHFSDYASYRGTDGLAAGMGVSAADFDLDGVLDLYLSNMYSAVGLRIVAQSERFFDGQHRELHEHYRHHASGNTLLRGLGGGRFEDVTKRLGGAPAGWCWGSMFVDFDNDGYEDLLAPNGFVSHRGDFDVESFFWRRVIGQSPPDDSEREEYRRGWSSMLRMIQDEDASYNGRERDTAFRNLRGTGFVDVSACAGFDSLDDTRALALVDWDDDGRVDVLAKSREGPLVRFLRNQSPGTNHFVTLSLEATKGQREAIGARVELELAGRKLRRTLHAGEGFLAQSSRRMTFGLAGDTKVAKLTVRWPSGAKSEFADLAADTRYRIVEGEPQPAIVPPRNVSTFANAAPSPLEASKHAMERLLLVEKFPLAELSLPMLDGTARKVREFAGAPLLLLVWSAGDPDSKAQLQQLLARANELEAARLRVAALTIDAGVELAAARKLLAGAPSSIAAGAADGALLEQLRVLYLEVLGDTKEVELPAALLLDAAGQWVLGYLGPFAVDAVLADVEALGKVDVKARQTARIAGGRWILRSTRNWALLADVFQELGAADMATLLRAHGASTDR